ncbi:MAG: serine hydrolase [Oscillospiraceae bacterium]|jgi:CubicO group peptidase (beta-lactamase class C family)|nr:serine hydrolase [Oscillospiraceae bacterium]
MRKVKKRIGAFLLALAVFAALCPAAALGAGAGDALRGKIDAISKKYGAAGVSVAVIADGEIIAAYAYGSATKGSAPMTPETKLRVASISKAVVGMTIMTLQEEGALDIDADIGEYWGATVRNPSYRDIPVTMRYILSHMSSITPLGDGYNSNGSAIKNGLVSGNNFSRVTPGSSGAYVYNNYGFTVLGVTAELAAGETLNSAAKRNIFEPLGIDAAFGSAYLEDSSNLATIYRYDGSVGLSVGSQVNGTGSTYPGENGSKFPGGLAINVIDLAKLVTVLINDGEYKGARILSKESVALMETPVGQFGLFEQCLPLFRRTDTFGQSEIFYHKGNAYGVFNLISYNPATKSGVVVLTSGASGAEKNGIYSICADISEYVYGAIPELSSEPKTYGSEFDISEGVLVKYNGNASEAEIPEGVTAIGRGAFDGSRNLTKVTLPGTLRSIGAYAFAHCTSLKRVKFPDSLQSIGKYAFFRTALKTVRLPPGIGEIGEKALGFAWASDYETVPNYRVIGAQNSAAESYAEANALNFSAGASGDTLNVSLSQNGTAYGALFGAADSVILAAETLGNLKAQGFNPIRLITGGYAPAIVRTLLTNIRYGGVTNEAAAVFGEIPE